MNEVKLRIFVREDDFRYFPDDTEEDQSVSHVHLRPGERMTWTFDSDFTIHFNQLTPLHKHEYHGDAGSPVSDTVRHNADPGTYKYTVLVRASSGRLKLDDPEIIIDG